MVDDASRFGSVVAECLKTSTEALNETRKFAEALSKDKNRDGISLLEVKNRDMIGYLTELSYLMSVMSAGESIQDETSIFRSVKLRTILERMRPVEAKMKSQVDKLLSTGNAAAAKAMKPRPDMMEVEDGEDEQDSDSDDGDEEEAKPKKYVPPKVMAMHFDEGEDAKEQRAIERAKRRALQSSLIQDLREQYSDAPQEVRDEFAPRRSRVDEEKRQFEEDYFIRLQMTKKEKHEEKMRNRQNMLDNLLSFGDYMATERVGNSEGQSGKRKGGPMRGRDSKRFKSSKGGKGGSKGRKKAKGKKRI
ncbi:hypothetical protein QR680_009502 [Steinernema hermaphroditum]|uniref:Neuroguidin n=1 Tax=Steinernema hermaphroditum TaxID=289476 RepID=A0AA39IMZ2_9BILA|nr:hypothetical protein QR680_009502 [Steinernema hermaphroditum]